MNTGLPYILLFLIILGLIPPAVAQEEGIQWTDWVQTRVERSGSLRKLAQYSQADSLMQHTFLMADSQLGVSHPLSVAAAVEQARVWYFLRKYPEAIALYEEALTRCPSGDKAYMDPRVKTLRGLGTCKWRMGNMEGAMADVQESWELANVHFGESSLQAAECMGRLSLLHGSVGNFRQALAFQQKKLHIISHQERMDTLETAKTLGNIAVFQERLSLLDSAFLNLTLALSYMKKKLGTQHPTIALSYSNLGRIAFQKGEYTQSKTLFEKSISNWLALGLDTHPSLAQAYSNLGEYYQKTGSTTHAIECYYKALSIYAKTVGLKNQEVNRTLISLGLAHVAQKDYEKGREYFQDALATIQQMFGGLHPQVSFLHNNIGVAYLDEGNYPEALRYFEKALRDENNRAEKNLVMIASINTNIGNTQLKRGEVGSALKALTKSLEIRQQYFGKHHFLTSNSHSVIACLHRDEQNYELALTHFQLALACFDSTLSLKDPFANPDLTTIAPDQRLMEGLILKAGTLRLIGEQNDSFYPWLNASLSTYLNAIQVIDMMFANNESEAGKMWVKNEWLHIYERTLGVAWVLYSKTHENRFREIIFSLMENSKATQLSGALQQNNALSLSGVSGELISYEQSLKKEMSRHSKKIFEGQKDTTTLDTFLGLSSTKFDVTRRYDSLMQSLEKNHPLFYELKHQQNPVTLAELQKWLPDKETSILEFFLGDTNLYVMGISKGAITLSRTPFSEKDHDALSSFVNMPGARSNIMEKGKSYSEMQQFTQKAYFWYQKLVESNLPPSAKKLIIVPDGILGFLSFETLLKLNPETKDYASLPFLVKDHRIRYSFSSTLMVHTPAKSVSWSRKYYAGFASQYDNESSDFSQKFPPLQHNLQEVNATAKLMGGEVWRGKDATEQTFKKEASGYQVLHLALHSFVEEKDPLYSGLVFSASTQEKYDDRILYAYELYNMNLQADLVVLSACHSGSGKLQRGEGIMSLSRAFRYAGCPNVLMSLWQADDAATQEIVSRFFIYLKRGLPKDEALQLSKLDYLDSHEFTHPHFWAGLVLIGDELPVKPFFPWEKICWVGGVLLLLLVIFILRK